MFLARHYAFAFELVTKPDLLYCEFVKVEKSSRWQSMGSIHG